MAKNPDRTQITLIADTNMPSLSSQHQLQIDVGYQMKTSSTPTWSKQLVYLCQTDQCNSLNQLKRLLNALIVEESLSELMYLLSPVMPFHGEWCYRGANRTSEKCNITIPVSLCTQCDLIETMNQTELESCATCFTGDSDKSLLVYQKISNMTDQTNSSTWQILCGREGCNTLAVGDSIREKCFVDFHFNKFFNK